MPSLAASGCVRAEPLMRALPLAAAASLRCFLVSGASGSLTPAGATFTKPRTTPGGAPCSGGAAAARAASGPRRAARSSSASSRVWCTCTTKQ